MNKKRKGLGRGISALIPQTSTSADRPVDVFFPTGNKKDGLEQGSTSQRPSEGGISGAASDNPRGSVKSSQNRSQELQFSGDEQKNMGFAAVVTAAAKNYARGVQADDVKQLEQIPGAYLTELPLKEIRANSVNPRTRFDEEALDELAFSIREFGVFQPIVVRKIADQTAENDSHLYEIIMGERRFRASRAVGLETIPAIVRETEDENMLRDALLENLHRADLNALEEASAYQQLMSDFGITQEALAQKIGRSRSQISNTIRLLKLPETVQKLLAAGKLSAGHARALLALEDSQKIRDIAEKVVAESLSVRELEAVVAAPETQSTKKRIKLGSHTVKLDEITKRLSSRLDTKVSIKLGVKKGQLIIDFNNIAELNRVLRELQDEGY